MLGIGNQTISGLLPEFLRQPRKCQGTLRNTFILFEAILHSVLSSESRTYERHTVQALVDHSEWTLVNLMALNPPQLGLTSFWVLLKTDRKVQTSAHQASPASPPTSPLLVLTRPRIFLQASSHLALSNLDSRLLRRMVTLLLQSLFAAQRRWIRKTLRQAYTS